MNDLFYADDIQLFFSFHQPFSKPLQQFFFWTLDDSKSSNSQLL